MRLKQSTRRCGRLKIAFDLDGVLREGQLGFYYLCREKGWKKHLMTETEASCKPLLNPNLFTTIDDELYVITDCGTGHSAKQKRAWVRHFYGDRIKFLSTSIASEYPDDNGYAKAVAKAKVAIMLLCGIEVYFDDCPAIIHEMRLLTDKIKFVKYGTWI
jgi:hypothetical protein